MAKGQVKKPQIQAEQMIFALDIGTRSVIGMLGVVEDDKVRVIAIEKEEHNERAMIDGQIENIEKVAVLAGKVKKRLESKVHCKLKRVCVAAAGRALRTKRTEYEIDLPSKQLIDEEVISRLEAGAVGKIEEAFDAENGAEDESRRFYLVGYTVCQYYLDQYRMSSLKDHRGQKVKVDLIATFLPSEVVESLYTTMNKIGLEVVSVTLEPIAAINAAIPENLRLLNLVLVDIGAGTSDIAACTAGSVTGYTMATMAGDEITETIMKEYLVDFRTAEAMKAQIEQAEEVAFTDILGFERKASRDEVLRCIHGTSELLSKEIAEKVLEVNGGAPSALFLAGGGSKLAGLKEGITAALQMDANRVAIAGNNFRLSAVSDEYDLNNPEYATPLGIAVSSGLNLINDSFRVTLNGRSAKLFRSGSFTALNLLMMNGYNFQDILGRPGTSLAVTVNGKRKVFYGTSAQPASLFINKKEGKLSTVINAGDCIDFVPAVPGVPARACLGDIEGASECLEITLNGVFMPLDTPLKIGDIIRIRMPKDETEEKEDEPAQKEDDIAGEEVQEKEVIDDGQLKLEFEAGEEREPEPVSDARREKEPEPVFDARREREPEFEFLTEEELFDDPEDEEGMEDNGPESIEEETDGWTADISEDRDPDKPESVFRLNGEVIRLPRKADGNPYYLMDMIQYSGINTRNPKGKINLMVNGEPGMFQQPLKEGDQIIVEEEPL
ncbi:MAG: pilus assembly protein PilM [Dorea sp.]|jgi:cell division protein FtsA|nr:pilus assembly protein PilM [Dorea sp.]